MWSDAVTAPPVGLLAGSGRFPLHFARKTRSLGIPVVCVGIRDEAPPELIGLVERFYWTPLTRLGRMIRCFKRDRVAQMLMAGKIHKTRMHTPLRFLRSLPDWRFLRFWFGRNRPDNRDD